MPHGTNESGEFMVMCCKNDLSLFTPYIDQDLWLPRLLKAVLKYCRAVFSCDSIPNVLLFHEYTILQLLNSSVIRYSKLQLGMWEPTGKRQARHLPPSLVYLEKNRN
jgi:hypothetical protein